jgi:hypothetical protein
VEILIVSKQTSNPEVFDMKRILISIEFLLLFYFSNFLFAQHVEPAIQTDGLSRAGELRYHMLQIAQLTDMDNQYMAPPAGSDYKNQTVGIILSAAIPGAGEMYAGSWIKGAIFMGLEIVLWIGYWQFSQNGQEWEDTFHEYADTHWSEERWNEWLAEQPAGSVPDTHTLPDTKTQQYYEMIGKYNQFAGGWDDHVDGGPALTANRDYYEDLRNNSNIQFKRASYCTMVSLANHVLSAFDTAWTIKKKNRRIEGDVRIGLTEVRDTYLPCLTMHLNW